MATIKVYSSEGVKELKCFDNILDKPFLVDDEDSIEDDGELTVGAPISE